MGWKGLRILAAMPSLGVRFSSKEVRMASQVQSCEVDVGMDHSRMINVGRMLKSCRELLLHFCSDG